MKAARIAAAAAVLWLAAAPGASAQSLDEHKITVLSSVGQFYDKASGSVAFLPHVGSDAYLDRAWTHHLLPESGLYRLKKKGNYFFRVNGQATPEQTSYLGVIVYLVFPGAFTHRQPLFLRRNSGRWQAGPDRTLDSASQGPRQPDVRLEAFFKAHAADSVKDADKLLAFTWHAAVESGQPHSWEYRSRWMEARPALLPEFLKVLGMKEEAASFAVDAQILQFNSARNPSKHLDFGFNTDHARGAYVRLFSPLGPQFDKAFYLVFE